MDYEQKKEIYLLNLVEGSMCPHPPEQETQSEIIQYNAWMQRALSDEVWDEDIPEFTKLMELENIRLNAEMSKDICFRFRIVKGGGYIWHEVNICTVRDMALLVIKDIHELVKREIIQKTSVFYKWVRKRMSLMASMEKEHGLIILEMKCKQMVKCGEVMKCKKVMKCREAGNCENAMKCGKAGKCGEMMECRKAKSWGREPYKIRFIEPEFKKSLVGYYRKELYKNKEHVERFVQSLLDKNEESDIEFMKIRMENDSTCWIQLYGKIMHTASGRTFVAIMVVNAYDYQGKEQLQELRDSVEHLIFEWNIEDDIVALSGPWEDRFTPLGEEIHKGHEIERYIYKNDLLKFQKISNLVLTGKSQEDILLRFYSHNKEKEYSWCTVSFLSVMYDNSVPMFAIGRVKDIDGEINQMLKIPEVAFSENKAGGDKWDYIIDVLNNSNEKQTHALVASELFIPLRNTGKTQGQINIVSEEWLKKISEILSVKDEMFLEEDVLYIFLYGADGNEAKTRQVQIRRTLEDFGEDGAAVNTGLAVWPDDGSSCSELKRKALDMLKYTAVKKVRGSQFAQNQGMVQNRSLSEGTLELVDEWYNSVRLNQQLQNQMELVESQLLLSQIQPHFIYNVLANIKAVMFEDRDKASELLVRFTRYLRSSFRSIGREGLVPFTEVIKCLNDYIELEKYRFGDKISVVYDLQFTGFVFTYFILQPIVENSIRHGICKKDSPGTLLVRTYKEKEKIYIVVEDNGVGFEIAKKELKEGGYGIGLKNVELRLRYLLGGELHVSSSSGIGTRIELVIPEI